MKNAPKAKPPTTICQCQGIANAGLESDPTPLSNRENAIMPTKHPATTRQEAMPCRINTAPPIMIIRVDVSPMEPGICPTNASHQV